MTIRASPTDNSPALVWYATCLEYCSIKLVNAYSYAFDVLQAGGVARVPESSLKGRTFKWYANIGCHKDEWGLLNVESIDRWEAFVVFWVSIHTKFRWLFVLGRTRIAGGSPMLMSESSLTGEWSCSSSCMLWGNISSSWAQTINLAIVMRSRGFLNTGKSCSFRHDS